MYLYTYSHLNWSSYIDHYARDHPALLHHMITRKRFDSGSHGWTNSDFAMTEDEPLYLRTYPPGVYQWLCAVLNKQKVLHADVHVIIKS